MEYQGTLEAHAQPADALAPPPPPGRARDSQRVLGGVVGGRYRIEQRLGRGTAGVVYRATHADTGGQVALKLLRKEHVGNARVLSRFLVEAKHLHRLHHPNTVRLYDYGQTTDGVPFLVMEYLEGPSLDVILRREGRLSVGRVVAIAEQILKSLGEAHHHNVVHRDVKPANVIVSELFGEPDFVKVVDFGIACLYDRDEAVGESRGPVGSPICMAPEQWTSGDVDGRTDLYALGCVMYQLLTGRPPFQFRGPAKQIYVRYMFAHLNQVPPTPNEVVPGVCPEPLSSLVMQLLEKRPGHRPANAHAVLASLDAIRSIYRFDEDGWHGGGATSDTFDPVDPELLTRTRTGEHAPVSLLDRIRGKRPAEPEPEPTEAEAEVAPAPVAATSDRAWIVYGVVIALLASLIGAYVAIGTWLFFGEPDIAVMPGFEVSTTVDAPPEPPTGP